MGMKINAELPLPANLRRNTRFRKNWQRSRRNVMRRFGRFLKENPINLLLSWDHVPQTMKILCATM